MANTTTFGATIVPSSSDHTETLRPLTDSPSLTPAVSRDPSQADFYDQAVPIQSPFYQHPPASHEAVATHGGRNSKLNVAVFEKDIESCNATPLTPSDEQNPFTRNHCVQNNKEDTMWPSKLTLKQKKKAEKQTKREKKGCRGCAPLRNRWSQMSKRNRLLTQIAIAIFVIGVAVALGVGISSAVKGTYYVSEGTSKTVGG